MAVAEGRWCGRGEGKRIGKTTPAAALGAQAVAEGRLWRPLGETTVEAAGGVNDGGGRRLLPTASTMP